VRRTYCAYFQRTLSTYVAAPQSLETLFSRLSSSMWHSANGDAAATPRVICAISRS